MWNQRRASFADVVGAVLSEAPRFGLQIFMWRFTPYAVVEVGVRWEWEWEWESGRSESESESGSESGSESESERV